MRRASRRRTRSSIAAGASPCKLCRAARRRARIDSSHRAARGPPAFEAVAQKRRAGAKLYFQGCHNDHRNWSSRCGLARYQSRARQISVVGPQSIVSQAPLRATGEHQKRRQMYRIREVDGQDDDVAETLTELHRLTFFESACVPEFDWGHWWLVFLGSTPVAFAGLIPSTFIPNTGYFLSGRSSGGALWPLVAAASHAGNGSTGAPQSMVLRGIGHDRQCGISQQFHQSRLSSLPTEESVGVASYIVLETDSTGGTPVRLR
jgi:hypothetical protein